ncbi:hypothetical protein ZIOFF_006516 [Zingiber officinale]|uniref:cytokinin riboside 5'-monophosphate phosphoribohydrolase n=1 Tax=Zingiber officinale TaxID=94328 RepID=A0A8J5ICS0_ZINOF|nr:hypothetical protein ZIOFF_006516 [Zingiber officinale]
MGSRTQKQKRRDLTKMAATVVLALNSEIYFASPSLRTPTNRRREIIKKRTPKRGAESVTAFAFSFPLADPVRICETITAVRLAKGRCPYRMGRPMETQSDPARITNLILIIKKGMEVERVKEEEERSRFKRICVFCGSQPGKKASYQQAAVDLGNELVKSGIDLVYGGGSIGLMGLLSHAVHDGGRHGDYKVLDAKRDVSSIVFHVRIRLFTSLSYLQLTDHAVGEVLTVTDLHARKAEMARRADAFIALPGGYETLEELLEVITWAQLGIHKKPVGLLNVEGFYDSLLLFIDMAVDEGFISEAAQHIIISAPSAKELIRKLEDYTRKYEINLVWDPDNQQPLELTV